MQDLSFKSNNFFFNEHPKLAFPHKDTQYMIDTNNENGVEFTNEYDDMTSSNPWKGEARIIGTPMMKIYGHHLAKNFKIFMSNVKKLIFRSLIL